MRSMRGTIAAILLAAVAGGAPMARAQEEPKEPRPGGEKPDDASPASPPDAGEPATRNPGVKVTAGSDGFALQSQNGDFKVQLHGLVHV